MARGVVDKFRNRRQERHDRRERRRDKRHDRNEREKAEISDMETRALDQIEQGNQAVNDFANNQPTYEQMLGDMPASSQMEQGRFADVQDRALARLEQVGNEGWTNEDRAALDAAQRQTALQEQSQRQAVMQQAQMRGAGGGGASMAGALMAQQAGANRNADVAAQMGIAGRDRALAAVETGANMAGQRAGAIDSFNQWATGHRSAARQGVFDNAATAAGMRNDAATNAASFYENRANNVRQRRNNRRFGIMNALRGGAQTVASIWTGAKGGGGGGSGGGAGGGGS